MDENAVINICKAKHIDPRLLDMATTKQLIRERSFPALSLVDGTQVSFEDIIPAIARELYILNPLLSKIRPIQGKIRYGYRNAGMDRTQEFLINATYSDLIEFTLAIISRFPELFSEGYMRELQTLYQHNPFVLALAMRNDVTAPPRDNDLMDWFHHAWAKMDIPAPAPVSRPRDTLLPLECHYGPNELLNLCFDLMFLHLSLTTSMEHYIRLIIYLELVNQTFVQYRPNQINMFISDLIELFGRIICTTFFHTDDFMFAKTQLGSRAADEPVIYSDDDLVEKIKNAPPLTDRTYLQYHASDRFKSRAVVLTIYVLDVVQSIPLVQRTLPTIEAQPIFHVLDTFFQALKKKEPSEIGIPEVVQACKNSNIFDQNSQTIRETLVRAKTDLDQLLATTTSS